MLVKGRIGFDEAYGVIRVPKKWRPCEHMPPDGLGDLPNPDLFDYSA